MDNLVPPPNGSPEEIQAWNNMMDTMVTFIKASTHLMNTITQKVRPLPGAGAGPLALPMRNRNADTGCEPECDLCIPKPPCGVCSGPQGSIRRVSSAAPAPRPPKDGEVLNATIAPGNADAQPEVGEEAEAPPEDPAIDEPPAADEPPEADEPPAADEPAAADEPPTADEPPAAEEQPDQQEPGAEPPPEAPPATDAPKPNDDPAKPPQAAPAAGDTQSCVCSAIRAKRLQAEKKAACVCPKYAEEDQPAEEPVVEQLCGCGPTVGNQASMVQDMVEKLANAQNEINQLQEEMARLQRMDTSRRTGGHAGPNPAALYKEIMRDSQRQDRPSQRISPSVRQRLFQSGTSGSPEERASTRYENMDGFTPQATSSLLDRTDPAIRYPNAVPQRLFQTNTTMDSSQGGACSPKGAPAERTDPAIRYPNMVPQRLFQTSTNMDFTDSRFGTPVPRPERTDPAIRYPNAVPQRLFQTNTTVDSQPESRCGASVDFTDSRFGTPVPRPERTDPAIRYPNAIPQRLFQTNTTVDSQPESRFGASGFELSSIPGEGRQLPEGFVGCIPCDANRMPSTLGIPSDISPIPGSPQGRILPSPDQMQGSMGMSGPAANAGSGFRSISGFQDSPIGGNSTQVSGVAAQQSRAGDRTQYLRPPQQFGISRQDMSSVQGNTHARVGTPEQLSSSLGLSAIERTQYLRPPSQAGISRQGGNRSGQAGPQYVAGGSPCRRQSNNGGNNSGFRSLGSSYQVSPNGISGNSALRSMAPGYQDQQGPAADAGSGFRSISGFQDSTNSPPPRVVICGPTPPPQSSCNPGCQSR